MAHGDLNYEKFFVSTVVNKIRLDTSYLREYFVRNKHRLGFCKVI
ncbi:hypothetical protein tloyanaT_32460 [Thalassotalea loyana]|uniref:Uncharacterized protein n=1 Tax=Thalassotalea loyana TaxID=280483 RepID=A0ABQ6HFV8_9GAMM|nr:hypothetical protein tloyanaT_32460 [Thalassotalea loyana]